MTTEPGKLHCDECKKEYSVEDVLQLCDMSLTFPERRGSFTCTECEEENDVEISDSEIKIGILTDGKVPTFEVLQAVSLGSI